MVGMTRVFIDESEAESLSKFFEHVSVDEVKFFGQGVKIWNIANNLEKLNVIFKNRSLHDGWKFCLLHLKSTNLVIYFYIINDNIRASYCIVSQASAIMVDNAKARSDWNTLEVILNS